MQPSLNLVPTVQQPFSTLLTTYEPEFLRFGYSLFLAFATIVITWHGMRMMFSDERLGEQCMFDFAKLLLFVSFGYSPHHLLRGAAAGDTLSSPRPGRAAHFAARPVSVYRVSVA